MRRVLSLLIVSTAFLQSPGADLERSLDLRGLIYITDPKLPTIKWAAIHVGGRRSEDMLLREGDAHHQSQFGVDSILPKEAKVIISDWAKTSKVELRLPEPVTSTADPPSVQFRSAKVGMIVDLLQELSGRTIVAPAQALRQGISVTTPPVHSRAEAASALEEVLRTNDLILTVRGEKFAFLMPPDALDVVSSIPNPPSSEQLTNGAIPAGLIKFNNADVAQALDVYQMLRGRTVIYPGNIRAKVAVRTQTLVERDEEVWLMNAMLRLAGLVVVPEADKFVFAVPPSMTNSLPNFDRKAALAKAAITNDGAAAPIRLSGADPQQMLDMAAVTMGRIPIPILPPIEVPRFETYNLRTEPLDQAESIFALEAWARLNGFAFELVGSDEVAITQRAPEQP